MPSVCRAIRIYVVKDIRDKAITLEQYEAQAQNMDVEIKAREIRLRAERQVRQML